MAKKRRKSRRKKWRHAKRRKTTRRRKRRVARRRRKVSRSRRRSAKRRAAHRRALKAAKTRARHRRGLGSKRAGWNCRSCKALNIGRSICWVCGKAPGVLALNGLTPMLPRS